jgi:hypothetical protein
MPRVAWTLTDNSTGSPVVLTFPINPNEFTAPARSANIKEEIGIAPNGVPVLFQGRDAPKRGSFSGAITSEAQYNDWQTWMNKWYPMTLTDDQSQTWDILITNFSLQRLRRAINQWRYDYSVEFIQV